MPMTVHPPHVVMVQHAMIFSMAMSVNVLKVSMVQIVSKQKLA